MFHRYDESGNVVDATYDNPADAQEDGGIYDEPAFNQGAEKNNVSLPYFCRCPCTPFDACRLL
jgi:hypothetical protein